MDEPSTTVPGGKASPSPESSPRPADGASSQEEDKGPTVTVLVLLSNTWLSVYSLVFILFGVWSKTPDGELKLAPSSGPPGRYSANTTRSGSAGADDGAGSDSSSKSDKPCIKLGEGRRPQKEQAGQDSGEGKGRKNNPGELKAS